MAKDREIVCVHYEFEHKCKLDKDAVFRGLCQTCPQYRARKGAPPARTDERFKKLSELHKKEHMNND